MKISKFICLIAFLELIGHVLIAQPCNNNNTLMAAPYDTIRMCITGNTLVVNCMKAGEYSIYEVQEGASYTWETCGGTFLDTRITLFDASNPPFTGGSAIGFNDDACGSFQSMLIWTSSFNGFAQVALDLVNCLHDSSCITLKFTKNTWTPDTSLIIGNSNYAVCAKDSFVVCAKPGYGTYSWYGGLLNNPTIQCPLLSPQSNEAYVVMVEDSLGCQFYDNISIDLRALPLILSMSDSVLCIEDTLQLTSSICEQFAFENFDTIDNSLWQTNTGTTYASFD